MPGQTHSLSLRRWNRDAPLRCPDLAETLGLEPIPPVSKVINRKVLEAPDPSRVGSAEVSSSHGCGSFYVNRCLRYLPPRTSPTDDHSADGQAVHPSHKYRRQQRQLRGLPTRELPNPGLATNNSRFKQESRRRNPVFSSSCPTPRPKSSGLP